MPDDLAALLVELRGSRDSAPATLLFGLLPRLRAMARRHLPPHSPLRAGLDSEDLLQEGLLQLLQNVSQFRGTTWPEFLAFVHSILNQKAVNQVRRQRVRRAEFEPVAQAESLPAEQPTPSVDFAAAEDRRRVQRMVQQLPEPYRAAMLLRIEGLDNAEIAARFALPQDLVRQRLSRAVKLLQERW
jgi:RNA polymerase sigma-70 factor, ECF subfamily